MPVEEIFLDKGPLSREEEGPQEIKLPKKQEERWGLFAHALKGAFQGAEEVGRLTAPHVTGTPIKNLPSIGEALEEKLPSETFAEKSTQRAGKLLPFVAAGPGGIGAAIGSSLVAGVAGQTAEEMGAGEFLQGVSEITGMSLPKLIQRLEGSTQLQNLILNMGRRVGMSEEALAPLMSEQGKKRFLGAFASAGEKTQRQLQEMQRGVSRAFRDIAERFSRARPLNPREAHAFANQMQRIGLQMPSNLRRQLTGDAIDLVNAARQKGGLKGEDLINFLQDVNSRYNLGATQLQRFKGPIVRALRRIDPQLAREFNTVNQMYIRGLDISRRLRPNQWRQIWDLGEATAFASSLATGNWKMGTKILGLTGMRRLANEFLTNPRLQNLIQKAQNSISNNRYGILKKIGEELIREYQDSNQNNE